MSTASVSALRDPLVVVAFSGWNDAGEAASQVLVHLQEAYDSEPLYELEPDDFYDFQATRPQVTRPTPDESEISWPSTELSVVHLPDRDLVLVSGPEPNLRWRAFCAELVSAFRSIDPTLIVILGAMLTDSPHSRPVPVSATSSDPKLAEQIGLPHPDYEGPTGITGVLGDACRRVGLPVVSLWASVPHYVSSPPNPKATLALLTKLEDILDLSFDPGELPELSQAWQRGVDELAAEEPEIGEYIAKLEEAQDEADLPEASGDVIAAEFMRYLRRQRPS
ncbi:carboxylate--amine ligase [Parenemella sanctibonifatiensis]|uniref:Carboxylate--amine ligase n=1 Tax=Parenemella sanctibonifatiensis TaxID=2016505 RepID=A0A255EHR3_9ACTN|nr:carboxylate--amine ligase [Parenemella sanctibonifatiensis]OYN91064.1 carboxylate--amine ligase [Parenemella sanctibonifatiensis]